MPRTKPASPLSLSMGTHLARIRQAKDDHAEREDEEVRDAQAKAKPDIEKARAILAELDAFEQEHGEELRQLGQLSDDDLPPVVPIVNLWARIEHARSELRFTLTSTRQNLERAISEVERLTVARLDYFNPAELRWLVERMQHAPRGCRDLLARLSELLGQLAAMVARARPDETLALSPLPPAPSAPRVVTDFEVA